MKSRPPSAIGALAAWSWFGKFSHRALVFGLALVLCLILAIFPQRYRAVSTLAPTNPATLGLGGALGQLGAQNTVFGSQAAIEIALRIGDSQDVRNLVIKRRNLTARLGMDALHVHRWLSRKVDVRSLRGGIIQIDLVDRDAGLAQDIVTSYADALESRLGQISREQTAYKRQILEQLVREATSGLSDAQSRYDSYRLAHRNADPASLTAEVATRVGSLEGALQGKRVTLAIARQMYSDDNFQVRQILAEVDALKRQLAEAKATNPADQQSVGGVVASTSVLYKLQRELSLQRGLYDSYMRFLQGTSVEDLASSANVRILEPPHIDTARQYWLPAIAVAALLAILWAAIEFYRLRPPVGAPVAGREPLIGAHGEEYA